MGETERETNVLVHKYIHPYLMTYTYAHRHFDILNNKLATVCSSLQSTGVSGTALLWDKNCQPLYLSTPVSLLE